MATLDFGHINDGWLNTMPNDLIGAELIRKDKRQTLFVGMRIRFLKHKDQKGNDKKE